MEINYLTLIASIVMLVTIAGTRSLVVQSEKINFLNGSVPERKNSHLGVWVTSDGYIRQELFTNGRYTESRGSGSTSFTGNFKVKGDQICYLDDTGFTASAIFNSNDTLHYAGHVFYKEKEVDQALNLWEL